MPTAVLLINVEIGHEDDVFEELKKIPEVKAAYVVYGMYDIVAIVKAPDLKTLRSVISEKIRKIKYVSATLTHVAIEGKEFERS